MNERIIASKASIISFLSKAENVRDDVFPCSPCPFKPKTCKLCSGEFSSRKYLRSHFQPSHQDWLVFACDDCDYGSDWVANLKTHKELKHLVHFVTNVVFRQILGGCCCVTKGNIMLVNVLLQFLVCRDVRHISRCAEMSDFSPCRVQRCPPQFSLCRDV